MNTVVIMYSLICKRAQWSVESETQEKGTKWVGIGLLEIVGLEVMAEGVRAAVHIWRTGGREFQFVGAVTLKQKALNEVRTMGWKADYFYVRQATANNHSSIWVYSQEFHLGGGYKLWCVSN